MIGRLHLRKLTWFAGARSTARCHERPLDRTNFDHVHPSRRVASALPLRSQGLIYRFRPQRGYLALSIELSMVSERRISSDLKPRAMGRTTPGNATTS
jgi:hypothetical protein